MAKTNGQYQKPGKKTGKCNKPTSFHAKIANARQPEETKHVQHPAKAAKILPNRQDNETMNHEGDIVDNDSCRNWSQIPDYVSAHEVEILETTKKYKAVPYQLQQWAFETSNANITLAERLEKLTY